MALWRLISTLLTVTSALALTSKAGKPIHNILPAPGSVAISAPVPAAQPPASAPVATQNLASAATLADFVPIASDFNVASAVLQKLPGPLQTSFETLRTAVCDETISGVRDADYRGCQTKTRSGHTCQKWTSQSPHKHTRSDWRFPHKGLGDHNFCRNPDEQDTIWCYTDDTKSRWDYCEPKPDAEQFSMLACTETLHGVLNEDYRGCQTQTRSGKTCQKWTSQSPHKHGRSPWVFPQKGLGDHNFCRNPDAMETIWCYTDDANTRWEYCEPKSETLLGEKDSGARPVLESNDNNSPYASAPSGNILPKPKLFKVFDVAELSTAECPSDSSALVSSDDAESTKLFEYSFPEHQAKSFLDRLEEECVKVGGCGGKADHDRFVVKDKDGKEIEFISALPLPEKSFPLSVSGKTKSARLLELSKSGQCDKDLAPPVFHHKYEVVAELMGLGPGYRVLDWGAGCGHNLDLISEKRGFQGIALDLVKSNAEWGREHLKHLTAFCAADGAKLDFIPNSFDAVISNAALYTVETKEAQCDIMRKQVLRVLRPGGCAWFGRMGGKDAGTDNKVPQKFWSDNCLGQDDVIVATAPEKTLFGATEHDDSSSYSLFACKKGHGGPGSSVSASLLSKHNFLEPSRRSI